MKYRNSILSFLGFAVLVASANAQVTKSGNGFLFRLKYKAGQTISYNMITEAKFPNSKVSLMKATMPMIVKIQGVKKDSAQAAFTLGPTMLTEVVDLSTNPPKTKTREAVKQTKATAEIDSRNRISRSKSGATATIDMFNLTFPERAIKPGMTWDAVASGQVANLGNVSAKTKYRFVGVKTINGISVAELAVELSGTQGNTILTGKGTILLRTADGTYQSSTMSVVAHPSNSGSSQAVFSSIRLLRTKG